MKKIEFWPTLNCLTRLTQVAAVKLALNICFTVLFGLNSTPLPMFVALNQRGLFKEKFQKIINLDLFTTVSLTLEKFTVKQGAI